ncbi:hypothetical protein P5704_028035 (plasmid) [Pseudomonas sp. FeN3W]|nr:hypothetical protein P5704_028035 [Pseudomonas sp. FeN3W]
MQKYFKISCVLLLATISGMANADLRFQRYVPELKWLSGEAIAPETKVDALIVAPKGLSCRLPAKDGFCRIPLVWFTSKESPAGLWRIDGDKKNRMAYAYDGVVDAYVRFEQELEYQLRDGATLDARLMDAATLTAEWDDSWATNPPAPEKAGEITASNGGSCQIYTGFDHCEVALTWTSSNVATTSVWQRTANGLVSVIEDTKEGSLPAKAYDFSVVYELREGKTVDGDLLAATITKGFRVEPEGSISLPDGDSCNISSDTEKCGLRVKWQTNDLGTLWIRETAISALRAKGQDVISIGTEGAIVDLRAGASATGEILARQELKAILSPNTGRFIAQKASCEIPYADDNCPIAVEYTTTAQQASVWTEDGELVTSGASGSFTASATDYGTAYLLRAGQESNTPILASYIAKGIKQSYTGTLKQNGPTECVFNYQRGDCILTLDYTATDKATLWHSYLRSPVGGGGVNGSIPVTVHNYDGASETINAYDLRIHGPSTPRITDPLLTRFSLLGKREPHTATLAPVTSATCNMIYSRNDCDIALKVETTSPLVSLWNTETGEKVWQGSNSTGFKINVLEGEREFALREGNHAENDILASLSLKANRPSYYMRLETNNGDSCISSEYNGSCTIAITTVANTAGRLYYRDITTNPDSAWVTLTSSIGSTTTNFTMGGIVADRVYEVEARQYYSPGEPLDRIQVKMNLNAPHIFKLTSELPDAATGYPCETFYNSTYCTKQWSMAWETSAANTTQCWSRDGGVTYNTKSVNSAKNVNHSSQFFVTYDRAVDIYEGNVSCTTRQAAIDQKYHLLYQAKINKPKVLTAAETPAQFAAETLNCDIRYKDFGYCSQPMSHQVNAMGYTHAAWPVLYAQRVDGTYKSSVYQNASASPSYQINEDEKDVVYQLKVRAGTTQEDSDPVIDTFTMNHGYVVFTGAVFGSRAPSDANYVSNYYYLNRSSADYPYYFGRVKSGAEFAGISEDCVIHIYEDTCRVYLSSILTSGSAAASIFINGEFLLDFDYRYASNAVANLPIGTHVIEIRDGKTANSYNNRQIDKFEITVRRPEYTGSITRLQEVPNVPYHGGTVSFNLPISSNTSGYLYNKTTNKLLCQINPFYTSDTRTSTCGETLGVGDYTFELRTHTDESHEKNIVLDTYSITIEHNPQTMEVNEYAPYAHFYSTCQRTYTYKGCLLYFDYKNGYDSPSGSSVSVCTVNSVTGAIVKRNSLVASTSVRSGNATWVYEGDEKLLFVDGPVCPSDVDDKRYPIMAERDVSTTAPSIPLTYSAAYYTNGNKVEASTDEADTWICTQNYENDNCYYQVVAGFQPSAEPGQHQKAYLAIYRENSAQTYGNTNSAGFSTAQSIAPTSDQSDYFIVICEGTGASSGACIKDEETIRQKLTVKRHLPVYVGSITAPNGTYCQGIYKASTCKIALDITTDSGYVTVHRDGVYLEAFTNKSLSKTFDVPVKAKGVNTVFEIRDGSSKNGRMLASIEVTPETYDPNRFAFSHESISTNNDIYSEACIVSSFVEGETSGQCSYPIGYKSDSTKKYIKVSTGAAGTTGTIEVSGNGAFTAHLDANLVAYPFGESYPYTRFKADGYADPESTSWMDVVYVRQKNTVMSEKIFSSYAGVSLYRSNASLGTSYRQCYSYWNGYYSCNPYSYIKGSYLLNLYQGPVLVDDITLSVPSACSSSKSKDGTSNPCNAIDYLKTRLSMATGQQTTGSIGFNDSSMRVKRIFYRAATPSEAQYLADPTFSINGTTRPVNMDGAWHYVDLDHVSAATIEISALNIDEISRSLTIDWFAEYYEID